MNHNIPLFSAFLGAAKAFNKINHKILFKKTVLGGVPIYFVRLLWYWCTSQVLWGSQICRILFLSLMAVDKEVSLVHSCLQFILVTYLRC